MTTARGELHPFRLALRTPFVTAGVSVRFRAGFLVSLTADGHTGWGEASPLPGWSRNSLWQTETALRATLEQLDAGGGAAPRDPGGGLISSLVDGLDEAPHARSAVAGAWADLQARRAGRTLADHLASRGDAEHGDAPGPARVSGTPEAGAGPPGEGRAAPKFVAVNALIAAPGPDDVGQAAQEALRSGFGTVKLKVGAADPAVDADRVRAARSAMGPAPELRLDANGAWDEPTAVDMLRRLEACDIAFCEEPVAGIEATAAVGRRTPVPVAVDESMRSEADAVRALRLGVGTLVVKPQALGGPDVALTIAALAREAGAAAVITSFVDSAVGLAHALHVAAACDAASGRRPAHGLATALLLADDVAEPPAIVSGSMRLPSHPGLGLSLGG